jgi:hypothetical protein
MSIFSKSKRSSSRSQIQIKEVVDNVLVLPSNEYRLILETSSVNFELKSEEEQDVIIDSFQNFLNSLPCEIQILVRVREVDIDRYVEEIAKTKVTEKVPAYKKQIEGYCNFVKKLVSGNKILSRRFYIVIPYKHAERHQDMKLIKEHLSLEKDIIVKGLERMQMIARSLTGREIINLFYGFYNPESLKTQALTRETVEALLKNNYV